MVGRKKGSGSPTGLEMQMMQVLWRDGPSNVQHVQKNLPEEVALAYTTVQTMLNVLERKGRVRRRMNGRAFDYEAVVSRETVLGGAIRDLAERMFGGSSEELVMSLIKSRQIDPEKIADLTRELAVEEGGDGDE